jgi:hypothetical protein
VIWTNIGLSQTVINEIEEGGHDRIKCRAVAITDGSKENGEKRREKRVSERERES